MTKYFLRYKKNIFLCRLAKTQDVTYLVTFNDENMAFPYLLLFFKLEITKI